MKETTELFTSSATIEWGTPRSLVDGFRALGYNFSLDVCATPGREMCPAYYGPPPEEIGKYKITKGPDKGQTRIDLNFYKRAMEAWARNGPIGIDALKQPWTQHLSLLGGGWGWENPPFGRAIKAFMRKTFEEAKLGGRFFSIVPSRTGSSWWHEFIEPVRTRKFPGELEFFKGRLTFTDMDGNAGDPAPFDMALVVFDGSRLGAS